MKNKTASSSPSAPVYLPPEVTLLLISPETIVCQSPLPGGNEGVGFENWN